MDIAQKKGKSIQCGKIDFIIKERSKDSKNFTETHVSLIFNNNNNKKKRHDECSYINLFFKEDSIQYIGTPSMLATINHKRKRVQIDSSKDRCANAELLLSEFMAFYRNDLASAWSMGVVQKKLIETDSSVVFTLQSNKLKPMMTEKYRKKMHKNSRQNIDSPLNMIKNLYTQYTDVYECRKGDTLLLRYSSKVKDTKPYTKEAVVESNSYLIATDINNQAYQSLDFYSYLSYLQDGYKTNIVN